MKLGPFLLPGLILLAVSVASPTALGQETGWYVGSGLGSSDDDVLDETANSWKLLGGYQVNKHLAFEAAFVDLGEFDILFFSDALSQDGIALEVIGRLPVGENGAVIGKVGFFSWEVEAFGVTDDGTDSTFGFGGEYRFASNWAVRAEWERFTDVSGGDVDLISASIVYSFRKESRPLAQESAAPVPESKPVITEIPVPQAEPEPSTPEKEPAAPELASPEEGDANAQFERGHMYSTGRGVPKDDALAVEWYRKAAAQGHAGAQYNLGAAYVNGFGVKADKETAISWFFKAGQSFIREGKSDLAIRAANTIEQLVPGHPLAKQLLTETYDRFGQ